MTGTQIEKCIGVVDGGMLILESSQTVTLTGVRVPRVGVPGGSVLRTLLQRYVQDKELTFEITGQDRMGYPSVLAHVDGLDLTDVMKKATRDYGYSA
jgi:hypothetical protein